MKTMLNILLMLVICVIIAGIWVPLFGPPLKTYGYIENIAFFFVSAVVVRLVIMAFEKHE